MSAGASWDVVFKHGATLCKGFYDELLAAGLPPDAANVIVGYWYAAMETGAANKDAMRQMTETMYRTTPPDWRQDEEES